MIARIVLVWLVQVAILTTLIVMCCVTANHSAFKVFQPFTICEGIAGTSLAGLASGAILDKYNDRSRRLQESIWRLEHKLGMPFTSSFWTSRTPERFCGLWKKDDEWYWGEDD
jgi:hypothetical protein